MKAGVVRMPCGWHNKDWPCEHYPTARWFAMKWVPESPERQKPRQAVKVFTSWTEAIAWATDGAAHGR